MKFNRFTWLGFLSNWWWYNPQEEALLKKEEEIAKLINDFEDFIRKEQPILALITKFKVIQTNNDVKEKDYPQLSIKLDSILSKLKERRLQLLDQGKIPNDIQPKIFKNHQPDALIGEIQTYFAYRKLNRDNPDPITAGFVIHYNINTAKSFHDTIQTGGKVLYTVDVNDILSIGDPKSTKHSVVAVGKDCKAAGIAQLEIDDRTDLYKTMQDYEGRAHQYQIRINSGVNDPRNELKQNMDHLLNEAKQLKIQLQGFVPSPHQTKTILIDFDSGHYAPSAAWKEAMSAWTKAGYTPKWSRTSRRT